jgi:hypothetical protein
MAKLTGVSKLKKAELIMGLKDKLSVAAGGPADPTLELPPATVENSPIEALKIEIRDKYADMSLEDLRSAVRGRMMDATAERSLLLRKLRADDNYAIALIHEYKSAAEALTRGPSLGTAASLVSRRASGSVARAETPPVVIPTVAPIIAMNLGSAARPLDDPRLEALRLKFANVSGRQGNKRYRNLTIRSLGMKPTKFTAGGLPCVTMDVLRELAGKPSLDGRGLDETSLGTANDFFGKGAAGLAACRAMDALCRMGSIDTMLASFIEPLQFLADKNSRVHCSLNLNTETGRLSSRRPNLQNQPALEKDQYKVRMA